MLRILHTADWHLGHSLHRVGREAEHAAFLAWLLDLLEERPVHALVVAGDVFDTANPAASAQAAWYGFLGQLRRRHPQVEVVVVGGNHDGAARLDAPHPLLAPFGVHVVGGLPRGAEGVDLDRLLCPIRVGGEVAGVVAAVPFLRTMDLPRVEAGDKLVAGVAAVYGEVLDAARERWSGGPLIATGHCYMVGGRLSEHSERKILGGHQHALPVDMFPAGIGYVALGHLHLAQEVGGRREVRYSGSPIPLSMAEAGYPHQVLLVTLDGRGLVEVEGVRVPRHVELLRVPQEGAACLDEVLHLLGGMPLWGGAPPERWPFLEVRVRVDGPRPELRRVVESAVEGRAVRLLKVAVERPELSGPLAEVAAGRSLDELQPEEVFRRRWASEHGGDPPTWHLEQFLALVEGAGQGEAA